MAAGESSEFVNEVRVLGRVSAAARERALPSGDTLVSVRVVVSRPVRRPARRRDVVPVRPASRVTVDTFECVAWGKRARTTLLSLLPDEHVVVEGALRRRFWRTGSGVASMVEIDVDRVCRVKPVRPAPREARCPSPVAGQDSAPSGQ